MFFKTLTKVFASSNSWVLAIVALILIFLLFSYSDSKGNILDRMTDGTPVSNDKPVEIKSPPAQTLPVQQPSTVNTNSYSSQPVANPSDLLPKDKNSEWASLNPLGINADGIQTPDLLQSGYHIGIDTIGQTLKNPSYDLRSDPIIEKKHISPWNMSTIEPNLARVPLEVGYGAR
jgi:hypothetical protein